jgi:Glycosyl transferases group 1
MIFLIESCRTPIYNRIAVAFSKTLQELGHTVHFYDPSGMEDSSFSSTINSIQIDYYFSTNVFNKLHDFNQTTQKFNFEDIRHKMIFIHHDSAFCPPNTVENINLKLNALIYHQEKISHFFIETKNIQQFNELGIKNCYPLNHASEFVAHEQFTHFEHDISFVGHLMSGLGLYPLLPEDLGHHLIGLAWNRYSRSSFQIQPEIDRLGNDEFLSRAINLPVAHRLSKHRYLMQLVTKLTMAYRGEVISNLKNHVVHIYGGDLSYGTIDNPLLKINREHVIYHAATSDYADTADIYAKSKVSLNISSLQFDSAINNRIIDIVLAGGFVLTDRRDDLLSASRLGDEISFDTPEEMQYKLDFFLNPKNLDHYLNVKSRIYDDFKEKYSYQTVCREILKFVAPV